MRADKHLQQLRDFFETAILCTNRQVNAEASGIIYDQMIVLAVSLDDNAATAWADNKAKIKWFAKFRRIGIEVDLEAPDDQSSYPGLLLSLDRLPHNIIRNLNTLGQLNDLRLWFKAPRATRNPDVPVEAAFLNAVVQNIRRSLKEVENVSIESFLAETGVDPILFRYNFSWKGDSRSQDCLREFCVDENLFTHDLFKIWFTPEDVSIQ